MNEREPASPSLLPDGRATSLVALAFVMLIGGIGGWLLHAMLPPPAPSEVPASPAIQGGADSPGPVVARVGDETLTAGQLGIRWKSVLSEDARRFHLARGGPRSYLEEAGEELLLAQEARRRGYAARPDVQEALRSASNRIVSRPLLADEVRAKAFPEEQLRKYFDAHEAEWRHPVRVRVREIAVTVGPGSAGLPGGGDARTPEEAQKKIEEARRRLASGEDFAKVAREMSEAPSAAAGGDIGWVEAGKFPKPFEDAALALAAGQVSPVVELPEQLVLLRAEEREEARPATFEEMRGLILDTLLQEDPGALARRYRIYVDELGRASRYELHPELVEGTTVVIEDGVVDPAAPLGESAAGDGPLPR